MDHPRGGKLRGPWWGGVPGRCRDLGRDSYGVPGGSGSMHGAGGRQNSLEFRDPGEGGTGSMHGGGTRSLKETEGMAQSPRGTKGGCGGCPAGRGGGLGAAGGQLGRARPEECGRPGSPGAPGAAPGASRGGGVGKAADAAPLRAPHGSHSSGNSLFFSFLPFFLATIQAKKNWVSHPLKPRNQSGALRGGGSAQHPQLGQGDVVCPQPPPVSPVGDSAKTSWFWSGG